MKKLLAILLACVFAVTLLTACGGNKNADTPADTPTAESSEKTAMDAGDLVSLIFKDLGLEMSQAKDILVDLIGEDGNRTVTFKLGDKECTYVVNAYDGTIISKDIPEGALEEAQDSGNPMETAINAAFSSIEGYQGGAENISASMDGSIIIVDFDYDGDHYTFYYDLNEGTLLE
ncbi:MAG: hypothetical protein IKZ95_09305 [Lachnospiraceae bacterium]|nr:hypothetical protein [Lachnospiraceae bacterium]